MTHSAAPTTPSAFPTVINAFTGEGEVSGRLASTSAGWSLTQPMVSGVQQLLPPEVRPEAWDNDRIGWGLILPEPPDADPDPDVLATAADAPQPIQELVAKRKGKVLRCRVQGDYALWTLRDYSSGTEMLSACSPPGMGDGQLPMYLLIYATPEEIPWLFQYSLNPVRHVGRLDLDGRPLENYVSSLMDDWSDSKARYDSPVVWSVDFGGDHDTDITTLMREAVAAPLHALFSSDDDMPGARYVDGAETDATGDALSKTLERNNPSLVVTTSHGKTGPLAEPDAMRKTLGMPVDQDRTLVYPDRLLENWEPDGAIWYAQACCSVGAESPSMYRGLFEPGSQLDDVLDAVADLGAMTAPLPRALLGAAKPLRAFIGHVEPTFNWTMAFPPNQQLLTADIQEALYYRVCRGKPVGLAMGPFYRPISSMLLTHEQALNRYETSTRDAEREALDMALYSKVVAYDRASTVILGDPTAAIPLPGG